MFRVLFVEDEELIRKGLIYTVDWFALNCIVPKEATNGKMGLELIENYKPHIVISDVSMPLLDGIEMIKLGKEKHEFESIIISGFDDFAYAQTAIRLGVSDYLLKPIEIGSLSESIKKLSEKFKDSSMMKNHRLDNKTKLDRDFFDNSLKISSKHVSYLLKKIKNDYHEKLTLKQISQDLNVSTTYLNQKFKEETGYTFNDLLNRHRIQIAMEILLEDNLKVYEISEQLGFSEYRYFSQVFRKYVGCSPTQFGKYYLDL